VFKKNKKKDNMLKTLENIQKSFSVVRLFVILVVASNLIVAGFCFVYSRIFISHQNEKIYSLQGADANLSALNQNTSDDRMAEAKAHVIRFHELFFNLNPDMNQIEYNMKRALLMADNSVYNQYRNLKDNNFFHNICTAGIRSEYVCDSVSVDFGTYPYSVVMVGRTAIVKATTTTIRKLVTKCELINVVRSDDDPNGFLIKNWSVVDNSDISTSNNTGGDGGNESTIYQVAQ
jgi:conjugative transposon TraK protein